MLGGWTRSPHVGWFDCIVCGHCRGFVVRMLGSWTYFCGMLDGVYVLLSCRYDVYCCCHNTSGILGLSFNVVTQVNKFT